MNQNPHFTISPHEVKRLFKHPQLVHSSDKSAAPRYALSRLQARPQGLQRIHGDLLLLPLDGNGARLSNLNDIGNTLQRFGTQIDLPRRHEIGDAGGDVDCIANNRIFRSLFRTHGARNNNS